MKHRAFVYVAVVSVLILIVGACSSADETEPTAVSQAAQTTAPSACPHPSSSTSTFPSYLM